MPRGGDSRGTQGRLDAAPTMTSTPVADQREGAKENGRRSKDHRKQQQGEQVTDKSSPSPNFSPAELAPSSSAAPQVTGGAEGATTSSNSPSDNSGRTKTAESSVPLYHLEATADVLDTQTHGDNIDGELSEVTTSATPLPSHTVEATDSPAKRKNEAPPTISTNTAANGSEGMEDRLTKAANEKSSDAASSSTSPTVLTSTEEGGSGQSDTAELSGRRGHEIATTESPTASTTDTGAESADMLTINGGARNSTKDDTKLAELDSNAPSMKSGGPKSKPPRSSSPTPPNPPPSNSGLTSTASSEPKSKANAENETSSMNENHTKDTSVQSKAPAKANPPGVTEGTIQSEPAVLDTETVVATLLTNEAGAGEGGEVPRDAEGVSEVRLEGASVNAAVAVDAGQQSSEEMDELRKVSTVECPNVDIFGYCGERGSEEGGSGEGGRGSEEGGEGGGEGREEVGREGGE